MPISGLPWKMVDSTRVIHFPIWLTGWNGVEVTPSLVHILSRLVQVVWSTLCSIYFLLDPFRPLVFDQKPKPECFTWARRWQCMAGKTKGAAWNNWESVIVFHFLKWKRDLLKTFVFFFLWRHYSIDEGALDWVGTWLWWSFLLSDWVTSGKPVNLWESQFLHL